MKGNVFKNFQNKICIAYGTEPFCSEEECEKWGLTYEEYVKVLNSHHAIEVQYKGQGDKIIHDHYFPDMVTAENACYELNRVSAYKDVARTLYKSDWLLVSGNSSEKYLLVGSPLAFDEIIEDKVMDCLHFLVGLFGGDDKTYDYDSDKIATLRDDFIRELVIKALCVKDVIYGTLEF